MEEIKDIILLIEREVVDLEKEYRNPLMWIFFAKSIQREINHKKDLIGYYEKLIKVDFHLN